MERKSGLVWLIAPAGHSHPKKDIFLYHYSLKPPPAGWRQPPALRKTYVPEMATSPRMQFANALHA